LLSNSVSREQFYRETKYKIIHTHARAHKMWDRDVVHLKFFIISLIKLEINVYFTKIKIIKSFELTQTFKLVDKV